MNLGTVKWFCTTKGYGFIEPESSNEGQDVFIHLTAVERSGYESLEKGQKVKYTLELDERKGKKTATEIEVVTNL